MQKGKRACSRSSFLSGSRPPLGRPTEGLTRAASPRRDCGSFADLAEGAEATAESWSSWWSRACARIQSKLGRSKACRSRRQRTSCRFSRCRHRLTEAHAKLRRPSPRPPPFDGPHLAAWASSEPFGTTWPPCSQRRSVGYNASQEHARPVPLRRRRRNIHQSGSVLWADTADCRSRHRRPLQCVRAGPAREMFDFSKRSIIRR